MTEAYLGEIQLFGFPYAPARWASCTGSLMAIRQNTALFSLIGVQYGGDGTVTFALPNFATRAPCGQGQGPGLTPRSMGEIFGDNAINLLTSNMPAHNHQLEIYGTRVSTAKVGIPTPGAAITPPGQSQAFVPDAEPNTLFAPTALNPAGGSVSHENRQPFLALNYSIALQGVFPSFS